MLQSISICGTTVFLGERGSEANGSQSPDPSSSDEPDDVKGLLVDRLI